MLKQLYGRISRKEAALEEAEIDTLDVKLDFEKLEVSEVAALDAFFTNEDAQAAKQNENVPPKIKKVRFSNTTPAPGDSIDATIDGFDKEGMDLAWEWKWKGKKVKESGTDTGDTLKLDNLPISDKTKTGDKYAIQLKLMDPLGAYVTHVQKSIRLCHCHHGSPAHRFQAVCRGAPQ